MVHAFGSGRLHFPAPFGPFGPGRSPFGFDGDAEAVAVDLVFVLPLQGGVDPCGIPTGLPTERHAATFDEAELRPGLPWGGPVR